MTVTYPALFHPVSGGDYFVEFPDLPGCFTQGEDEADARFLAADILGGWISVSLRHGHPVNAPSDPAALHIDDGFVALVTADVPEPAREAV